MNPVEALVCFSLGLAFFCCLALLAAVIDNAARILDAIDRWRWRRRTGARRRHDR